MTEAWPRDREAVAMLGAKNMAIVIFFVAHWVLSVFFQTFFLAPLRRSSAVHDDARAGSVSSILLTYISQGSSFLNAARLRDPCTACTTRTATREKDPHSPLFYTNVFTMMLATKKRYDDFAYSRVDPEPRFDRRPPSWPRARSPRAELGRCAWPGARLHLFYVEFATSPWMFALAARPLHHGPDPRRHRQLVRPQVRLPQLRQRRRRRATRSCSTSSRWASSSRTTTTTSR